MTLVTVAALIALDPTVASRHLNEAAAWCEAAGKQVWNRSLCGPILIADPATREYITSAGAKGKLPVNLPLANTAMDWNGSRTTMVLWPLPADDARRKALLAHELWHRMQDDLGFAATGPSNAHLEEVEGRVWLRLEARALSKAIESKDTATRQSAITDALLFRKRRHAIFRQAAEEERKLEMHEGLAEYTGVAVSGNAERLAVEGLARFESGGAFARSFAYGTGPAYGVLLDALAPDWRKTLKPEPGMASLLAAAYRAKSNTDVFESASKYDGGAVRQQELLRSGEHLARLKRLRALFLDGPVLELAADKRLNFSFDPSRQVPLDGMGTVYEGMQVTDSWGSIATSKEALITSDFQRVLVPAAGSAAGSGAGDSAAVLTGQGWRLELAPGWHVVPGRRPGDKAVAKIVTAR